MPPIPDVLTKEANWIDTPSLNNDCFFYAFSIGLLNVLLDPNQSNVELKKKLQKNLTPLLHQACNAKNPSNPASVAQAWLSTTGLIFDTKNQEKDWERLLKIGPNILLEIFAALCIDQTYPTKKAQMIDLRQHALTLCRILGVSVVQWTDYREVGSMASASETKFMPVLFRGLVTAEGMVKSANKAALSEIPDDTLTIHIHHKNLHYTALVNPNNLKNIKSHDMNMKYFTTQRLEDLLSFINFDEGVRETNKENLSATVKNALFSLSPDNPTPHHEAHIVKTALGPENSTQQAPSGNLMQENSRKNHNDATNLTPENLMQEVPSKNTTESAEITKTKEQQKNSIWLALKFIAKPFVFVIRSLLSFLNYWSEDKSSAFFPMQTQNETVITKKTDSTASTEAEAALETDELTKNGANLEVSLQRKSTLNS